MHEAAQIFIERAVPTIDAFSRSDPEPAPCQPLLIIPLKLTA